MPYHQPTSQVVSLPIDTKQMNNSWKRKHIRKYNDGGSVSSSSSSDESTKPVHSRQESQHRQFNSGNYNNKDYINRNYNNSSNNNDNRKKKQHVAIDCEMVGVGEDGQFSSLARVCIVNYYGDIVLDLYVKQRQEVTSYRTFVSGITEEHLISNHAVEFEECRERVQQILKDKILVGHGLKNDLSALGVSHPWYQVRDTTKYKPFMKVRSKTGILLPRKLKELTKEWLEQDIQHPDRPHCPVEDARAALSLYRTVYRNWEKVVDYNMNRTTQIQNMQKGEEKPSE